jgi:hypothetical protein
MIYICVSSILPIHTGGGAPASQSAASTTTQSSPAQSSTTSGANMGYNPFSMFGNLGAGAGDANQRNNPFAAMFANMGQQGQGQGAAQQPQQAAGAMNPFGMVNPMMMNPQMIQSMMSNPFVQQMMNQMMQVSGARV